jgi:hypothetical protein
VEIVKTIKQAILILLFSLIHSSVSSAVVFKTLSSVKKNSTWVFQLEKFKTSLPLPVEDKVENVEFSRKKLRKRLRKSAHDPRVEPLSFALRNNPQQIKNVANKFAKKGKSKELYNYLFKTIASSSPIKPGSKAKFVAINKKGYKLINQKKFANRFKKIHHNLTVDNKKLLSNKSLSRELLNQLKPYFNDSQRQSLVKQLQSSENISVDKSLLPPFAKKMVKKFTIYRGPNCFHAALAFQNMNFTNSVKFNVKIEKNYHRAMINYDELWRTLQSEFYEVNLNNAPVKYGDIIVFFEVPSKNPGRANFKWIRHTAAYLFGNYTFSKGSKSSNTPYTVKTLQEEWKTWKSYTDLMAVKVFRKSGRSVKKSPAKNLIDWMY